MYKEGVVITLVIALALIIGCAYTTYSDPVLLAEMQRQSESGTQTPQPLSQEDIDIYLPWIGYGLLVLCGLWVVKKIIESEIAVPLITIICGLGIVLFATYLFTYGDKDGDNVGDTQIIKVVQPNGNSPDVDAQYSEINQENTKTNLLSVFSITLYIAILLVAMVVVTGIGLVLHYRKNAT